MTPLAMAAASLLAAADELRAAAEDIEGDMLLRADAHLHTAREIAKDAATVVKQSIKNRRDPDRRHARAAELFHRATAALPGGRS